MDFGVGTYALGAVAGLLSTLSPCVLPIIPILLGSALDAHPKAPLALAGGLALSYAVVGTTLAWASAALGFDSEWIKILGTIALGLLGLVLLSGALQERFAAATAGISNAGNGLLSRMAPVGLWGQFAVGVVLGVVWSPCVGPTLGAAVLLASQGAHLVQVALLMILFGLGAALPVVVLAYVSRGAMVKMRSRMLSAGKWAKMALGGIMLALSLLILTHADKVVEGWLVDHSPAWLTELTTRF